MNRFLAWINRLNQRLLFFFIVVALVPLLIVGTLNIVVNLRLLNHEVEDRQIEVTRIVAQQMDSFLVGVQDDLRQIGEVWLHFQNNQAALNIYVHDLMAENAFYTSVVIMDAEGQETLHVEGDEALPSNLLQDRHEEEIFFRPERGEIYFSSVRLVEGQPYLNISIPLLENDQLVGVVAAEINLQQPWSIIENLQIGDLGYALLVDRRGNVIVHRSATVLEQRLNLASIPPVRDIGLADNIAVYRYESPIQGEVLGTAQRIIGPEWVLVIERPTVEAFQGDAQARQNTFWGMLAALVIAVMISLLVSRQITRPILRLRKTAQALGRGDLSSRIHHMQRDEIGDLAEAFNQMANRLEARISEIDQKNAELSIATHRANEATRLKSEFLATMSHELRTPLNAIIGFSDSLIMGLSGKMEPPQERKVKRIRENGGRLLNLINDVLDLTRIEAGRVEVLQEPFEPRAMISALTAQMEPLAAQKHLEFMVKVTDDVPPLLIGDQKRIEQILVNLLSNAFKFTSQGSVILEVMRTDTSLIVKVTDTGIGIPPHMHDAIFEEFRQVDGSATRLYQGSGLGLAITRNLVRLMHGQIAVESTIDIGSVFTVRLPLVIPEISREGV